MIESATRNIAEIFIWKNALQNTIFPNFLMIACSLKENN